ncbi:hypothetical protein C0584_04850 [Candidatus Parcubacteria bacterium]|nr:MAG: hypothetical protein C0584_04850 [Candidatus Parcubacteria bacterium]
MISNNFALFTVKIFTELIGDILYFPLWWYTRGFLGVLESQFNFLKNREKGLALGVWIKNIFKPMFGQNDWQGVLISIIMRIVQIIFRSIVMVFWLSLSVFVILFWLLMPLIALYQIIFQIFIL